MDLGLFLQQQMRLYWKTRNGNKLVKQLLKSPQPAALMDSAVVHLLAGCDWGMVERLDLARRQLVRSDDYPFEDPVCTIAGMVGNHGDVPEAVQWLVAHGASLELRGMNDWTPLHLACRRGHAKVVQALISLGANINAISRCDGGYTALMEACGGGHVSVVKVLLGAGADVNFVNQHGDGTARNIAARSGRMEIVNLLDSAGTKTGKRNGAPH